jgi:rhamnosyltransferase
LPKTDATSIAAHARIFNYPVLSNMRDAKDISEMGLKAAFLSNSFAAYRIDAMGEIGGFSNDVIFGEDMVVAAKLLLKNKKISYNANAIVYHSHNYGLIEEFKRYFDIGVLHSREGWLLDKFGKPEAEGKKFVISELRYLIKNNPILIPSSIIRTLAKFLGYRLGLMESKLSIKIKKGLSMNFSYWK